MGETVIRVAGPGDAAALSALGWETFLDTFVRGFAIPYPPNDLDAFFAASYAPDRFAALLADPARRAWIAERGGAPSATPPPARAPCPIPTCVKATASCTGSTSCRRRRAPASLRG